MIKAAVKGTEVFSWGTLEKPITAALSRTVKKSVYQVSKDIADEIKKQYFFYGDPNRQAFIYFHRNKGSIYSAELSYRYKSIPLSRYPVKQYRITVKRKILKTTRGGKFSSPSRFAKKLVPFQVPVTYVQIKRKGGPKKVEGKLGYKGWLHTGRRSGQFGFNGQTNTFSAQIFERNQQATWANNERLPIHRLFGPSVTEIVAGKEIQKMLESNKTLNKLSEIFLENLSL